jgi:SPP1 family holin
MREIKPDTIIRTVVLILALINQALAVFGKEAIPVTEDEVYQLVSLIMTIGAAVWAWWKNNSFTRAAIEGDKLKDAIKRGEA